MEEESRGVKTFCSLAETRRREDVFCGDKPGDFGGVSGLVAVLDFVRKTFPNFPAHLSIGTDPLV
jgi:hypothetical protein